ncbi:MAG TPA: hypothetical protein VIK10_00905 [Prolixibacteraceae bacterium]
MQTGLRKFVPILLILYFILLPYSSIGQYFTSGQDPASIKWLQINSENFQIIYPSDYEVQAQRVAHVFEKVYAFAGASLENKPPKISVILHSKVLKSNGFVAWAPSRIELYPTPNQEMYAQEWIEQLAIHELRHHSQIDKIESEMPGIFKILLGEQAASLIIGAYLPFWFLEGDAVVTETALSRTGRGRMPSFTMELKAQADEKGIYSLDKAYLGSYKDYIPDYYQLGYQIVSNIRNQNGGEVWSKVFHHIARNPLSLNALSKGLKLYTGKNQDEHYLAIMNNLRSSNPFNLNNQGDNINTGKQLVQASHLYTTYRFPYFVNDSTYIALKDPLDHIPSIVLINNHQQEKKIFVPGMIEDESMSYRNGKVTWIESKPDLRWTNKERSLLRILDIGTGKLSEKIYDEKLFAPVISPDGKSIAAVKFNDQNQSSFVLIDASNLSVMNEFKAMNNCTFFTPSWSADQLSIYGVELGPQGKSIVKVNLLAEVMSYVTKPVHGEIRKPIQRSKYLYYTADYGGKNEGYAFDLTNNTTFRILGAKYGIKDLQSSVDGKSLLYANYSSNGFKLERTELSRASWQATGVEKHFQDTLSAKLTMQDKGALDFADLDTSHYVSSKYYKIKNLINIHSWSPGYVDPDNSTVNTGFSIISQNKLTTAVTQFGYDYSTVNNTGKWIGKFVYAGWYPVLNFFGDYGKENSSYYQVNKHYSSRNVLISQDTVSVPYSQKVINLHFDISVPLNFSHGKMYRIVQPELQIGYSHNWQEESTPSNVSRGSYIPLTYRLYAHNLIQQSHSDIQPEWGQIVDLKFRNTPFGDRQLGTIASAEATIYLPGLLSNHGLRFYGGFQRKISLNYSYFSDLIYYPRGYLTLENNQLFTLKSDYVLPLLNPDWHLWHLYYLKRITLRVFYDLAQISIPIHPTNNSIIKSMNSTGIELLTDCHFLRFLAPAKLGVRTTYLTTSKKYTSEFIFSVNFKNL